MILNLTQHSASADQLAVGVVDMTDKDADYIRGKLNFVNLPTKALLVDNANMIAKILTGSKHPVLSAGDTVMIGGAPFFMPILANALISVGLKPVYAFSQRVSIDLPDGTKQSVFKHLGFVPHVKQ